MREHRVLLRHLQEISAPERMIEWAFTVRTAQQAWEQCPRATWCAGWASHFPELAPAMLVAAVACVRTAAEKALEGEPLAQALALLAERAGPRVRPGFHGRVRAFLVEGEKNWRGLAGDVATRAVARACALTPGGSEAHSGPVPVVGKAVHVLYACSAGQAQADLDRADSELAKVVRAHIPWALFSSAVHPYLGGNP